MLRSLFLLPHVGAVVIGPNEIGQDCLDIVKALRVHEQGNTLTADLTLAGKPCNTYGTDLNDLKLLVDSVLVLTEHLDERLHVIIYDVEVQVYQVPESVLPWVDTGHGDKQQSALRFYYVEEPSYFTVSRGDDSQYLNLHTWLPDEPYLYDLREHTDPFRLETNNYTRTFHLVYYDHRGGDGTHGVFLVNSNGIVIKISKTDAGKQYLEYDALGGVLDFHFLTGQTPKKASIEYARLVGLPANRATGLLGYGYRDVYHVAEVVYNYNQAGIPLETMWTDIDYMDLRKVFTLDPERFPIERMRELVTYLHDHDQHYIVMVDPTVSVLEDNPAYGREVEQDVFLNIGAVWPGVTVYPDWFHPRTQDYWIGEFSRLFDADEGVDIDGLWIDMNEAANFCPLPCTDPETYASQNDLPPTPPAVRPSNPRPLPGNPDSFQPASLKQYLKKAHADKFGLPNRDLVEGYAEYDKHNLCGTMMSSASRIAMQQRRPGARPLIITRSTYAGTGAHVGHWLGDNLSTWEQYRISISQILAFASMLQIPMVGADICEFVGNTTEELCARWAVLGDFYIFSQNHNEITGKAPEFYVWETVARSATNALNIRYRLLDYLYTSFYRQSQTSEPFLQPLFYLYPEDENTFANDLQSFHGDALLISPVTEESSTSVDASFPKEIFYDWYTGALVRGKGTTITLTDIDITHIPIHTRGGNIIPVRASSAMTTTELRQKDFQFIIAPDAEGRASGSLYLDYGDSLEQSATTETHFEYRRGIFFVKGRFARDALVKLESVTLLGQSSMSVSEEQKKKSHNLPNNSNMQGMKLVLDKTCVRIYGNEESRNQEIKGPTSHPYVPIPAHSQPNPL
ncbi:glycosyl hydrolases family 31-domain-containing protein [Aspergillus crustosus]